MRVVAAAGAAALALAAVDSTASAQFAVVDAANIIQSTATAVSTAQTLQNMIQQVSLMRQTLATINPTSFAGLQTLMSQGQLTYSMLNGDVTALGFELQDVNTRFDKLFPKNRAGWQGARYTDYDSYYGQWHEEIAGSAKVAERAQSAILLVEANNRAMADILGQSAAANGEVRQLQLINQQLALVYARLGDLVQNIATLGRITGNMAAASSGEKLLLREAKLRRRDGYTSTGAAARVLTRLP